MLVGVGGCWLVVRWREKPNASEIAKKNFLLSVPDNKRDWALD